MCRRIFTYLLAMSVGATLGILALAMLQAADHDDIYLQ